MEFQPKFEFLFVKKIFKWKKKFWKTFCSEYFLERWIVQLFRIFWRFRTNFPNFPEKMFKQTAKSYWSKIANKNQIPRENYELKLRETVALNL